LKKKAKTLAQTLSRSEEAKEYVLHNPLPILNDRRAYPRNHINPNEIPISPTVGTGKGVSAEFL
jgi:hypothetical protein